jgi:hypothetical protein
MILTYFFMGVVFTLLIDLLIEYLRNITSDRFLHTLEWDNSQRTLCVVLWPLALIWFLIAFFKSWFN